MFPCKVYLTRMGHTSQEKRHGHGMLMKTVQGHGTFLNSNVIFGELSR